jgi:hypothetical protein
MIAEIIASRKNRKTGATITLVREAGNGWWTICGTHGYSANHATRAQATDWMAEPQAYCPACAGIADGGK